MEDIFDIEHMALVGVGRVAPNTSWGIASHAHTFWEFIYFLHGCGRVQLPHATLRPQQYHLMIYPPGLPHEECSDPVDPEETLFFCIEVPGTPPLGSHLLLPDQRGDFRWLCEHIHEEFLSHGISPLAMTYARAFLHLIDRAWASSVPMYHNPIDLAVQYLHAHYMEPVSINRLAEITRLSPSHLAHRFRDTLGMTPMQSLLHIRLDAAIRLLTTTDLPIGEVALQVGFSDPLYFSRVFKRATRHSPSAYRLHATIAE